jgi:lysophospholipase L1-like esterase
LNKPPSSDQLRSRPLTLKLKLILAGLAITFLGAAALFATWRISGHKAHDDLRKAIEGHAWSMSSLQPGQEYELAAYPARPGRASPPTFRVRLNRFSVREREFHQRPAAGITRIIAVGDSTTFGTGVAVGERFTEHLQKRLDTVKPGRYEVLNAGRPGLASAALLDMLPYVFQWEPRLLIIGVMTNDRRDPESSMELRNEAQGLDEYAHRLGEVVRQLKQRGVGVVFWANTMTLQPNEEGQLTQLIQQMNEVGRRFSVPVVELGRVYASQPATAKEIAWWRDHNLWHDHWLDDKKPWFERWALHVDWAHPNAFGHQRLADALFPLVVKVLQSGSDPQ